MITIEAPQPMRAAQCPMCRDGLELIRGLFHPPEPGRAPVRRCTFKPDSAFINGTIVRYQ